MKASTSAIALLSASTVLAGPLRLRQMPATPCSTTSDCYYGQICDAQICQDYTVPDTGYSCQFNEDCPIGYTCNRTQQCVPQDIISTTTTPFQPTSTTIVITVTPTRPPTTVTTTVSKTTTMSSSSSSVSSSRSSSPSSSASSLSASSSRPTVVTSTSTAPYVPPSHIPNSGAGRLLAVPAAGLALLASCALLF